MKEKVELTVKKFKNGRSAIYIDGELFQKYDYDEMRREELAWLKVDIFPESEYQVTVKKVM